jgi:predicted glycoside hydrolase/deacetylase ChbG (UPF0249 family)
MSNSLIIVCDDAGFASVDRGIRLLADRTGLPISAEYLIEQDGAAQRAKDMSHHPLVSVGLHFELAGISDADRVQMSNELKKKNSCLGEQLDMQKKAMIDAKRQLELFREALGKNPAHISTHGNFNADMHDHILPWWREFVEELFEGDVPPMQLDHPHVRHNKYSWNLPGTARPPCTSEEFGAILQEYSDHDIIEFVVHPAMPEPGDASIDMLFDAEMRIADVNAAIDILTSGIVEQCGFDIVRLS